MASRRKYTADVLLDAVEHSTSVAGVLRHLGLDQAGGTHCHISRMIKRFDIDTSHFQRHQDWSARRRRTADDILVRLAPGSRRTNPPLLRRALKDIGRLTRCELCLNTGWWEDRPLNLEIDHIDGDYHNDDASNLRNLCPNCHSQTDSFSGRSRGKYAHQLPALPHDVGTGSDP